ncbi:MAG TPA: hypothetical protein VHQ24_02750 [Lachnospiraceae bacterium]|nr:hypothetical protein [Lachnospiraceae bacterium]
MSDRKALEKKDNRIIGKHEVGPIKQPITLNNLMSPAPRARI